MFLNKVIFFCCLITATQLTAQNSGGDALLQLDKAQYVSGETGFYNLFLPAQFKGKAVTLYVALRNETDTALVLSHYLHTQGSQLVSGSFDIPLEAKHGRYRLTCLALDAQFAPSLVATTMFPCYNDIDIPKKTLVFESPLSKGIEAGAGQIECRLEATPKRATQANCSIQITDAAGRPVAAEGTVVICSSEQTNKGHYTPAKPETLLLPSGIVHTVQLRDADNRPRQWSIVAVSDLEDGTVSFHNVDSSGKANIILPDFFGKKRFQIMDPTGADISVEHVHYDVQLTLAQQKKSTTPAQRTDTWVPLTAPVLGYLEQSRQRKKIDQYFGIEHVVRSYSEIPPVKIIWKTQRQFKVQNYERFGDMATFFNEVATWVRFDKDNKAYRATMYDRENDRNYTTQPLFIVDNRLTTDAHFVANLKPEQIGAVELLYGTRLLRKHYKIMGTGGVVKINSLRGSLQLPPTYESDIVTIHGLNQPVQFKQPLPDAALPQFYPVVYHNTALQVDATGKATITFWHPNQAGSFDLIVTVRGADGVLRQKIVNYEL